MEVSSIRGDNYTHKMAPGPRISDWFLACYVWIWQTPFVVVVDGLNLFSSHKDVIFNSCKKQTWPYSGNILSSIAIKSFHILSANLWITSDFSHLEKRSNLLLALKKVSHAKKSRNRPSSSGRDMKIGRSCCATLVAHESNIHEDLSESSTFLLISTHFIYIEQEGTYLVHTSLES